MSYHLHFFNHAGEKYERRRLNIFDTDSKGPEPNVCFIETEIKEIKSL